MTRKHWSRSNMSIGVSKFYVYVTNWDLEYQRLAVDCERLTRVLVNTFGAHQKLSQWPISESRP